MGYFRLYDDSGMDPFSVLSQWPWNGIVLIFLAAVLSVAVILIVTRRAIRDMAASARKTLDELTAAAPSAQIGPSVIAVTTGRGSVEFKSGGYVVPLAHREPDTADADPERIADSALVLLASKVEAADLDIRDFNDDRMPSVENGQVTVRASFSVRDPADITKLLAAALAAGFAEETASGREVITLADAEHAAGQRAIDEATRNAETVFEGLEIDSKDAQLLSLDLESDPASTVSVLRRVAKAHWSRARAT